jgi:SpoVK/Ycf46/Vps4 family AAA+-type ATPase
MDKNELSSEFGTLEAQLLGIMNEQLKLDPDFKKRFGDIGLDEADLKQLATIYFREGGRGKDSFLEVILKCDSPPLYEGKTYEEVDCALDSYMSQLSRCFQKLETLSDTSDTEPDSFHKTLTVRTLGKIRKRNLFSVTYEHSRNDNSGGITIKIEGWFAHKYPQLAQNLFHYVWSHVILDEDRLESLIEDEDEEEDEDKAPDNAVKAPKSNSAEPPHAKDLTNLGLEVYHGKENLQHMGGNEKLKEQILRDAIYPILHRNVYEDLEKQTSVHPSHSHPRAILFYGRPGTGKTLMARIIASEEKIAFVYLPLHRVVSKWMGESTERLTRIFDAVKKYSSKVGETILFIDEIDTLGSRSAESDAANADDRRLVNTFLTMLDGFNSHDEDSHILVIGSTNNYFALDQAIRSRFASEIEFPLPSTEDRRKILHLYAQQLSESELETIAGVTEGFSGRDLETACEIARKKVGKEIIENRIPPGLPTLPYYMTAVGEVRKKVKSGPTGESAGLYR